MPHVALASNYEKSFAPLVRVTVRALPVFKLALAIPDVLGNLQNGAPAVPAAAVESRTDQCHAHQNIGRTAAKSPLLLTLARHTLDASGKWEIGRNAMEMGVVSESGPCTVKVGRCRTVKQRLSQPTSPPAI